MSRAPLSVALLLAAGLGTGAALAQHGHVSLPAGRVLDQTAIPVLDYRIVATHPHDTASYTEGLVMADGELYEGTGLWGFSKLRLNDLETGEAIREVALDPLMFGEGVTVLGDRVFQLTYLGNRALVYDRATFERLREVRFPTQGWGLTTDGTSLYKSNGSSAILVLDPDTFETERTIYVRDHVGPVGFLNELEYVDGTIYANVWQTPFIAAIDARSGAVSAWVNLTGLNPDPERLVYPLVLNGVAHDDRTGHLLVTGKKWPHLWEIALVPRRNAGGFDEAASGEAGAD